MIIHNDFNFSLDILIHGQLLLFIIENNNNDQTSWRNICDKSLSELLDPLGAEIENVW